MNLQDEARALSRQLGGELADRVSTLKSAQKQLISELVLKYGFLESIQALYINPQEAQDCLIVTGHGCCPMCGDWFKLAALDQEGYCSGCAEEHG